MARAPRSTSLLHRHRVGLFDLHPKQVVPDALVGARDDTMVGVHILVVVSAVAAPAVCIDRGQWPADRFHYGCLQPSCTGINRR